MRTQPLSLIVIFLLGFALVTMARCGAKNGEINNGSANREQPDRLPENEHQNSAEITMILALAEETLSDIDDRFSWSTAAAEVAIAKDSSNHSEQAWTLIGQALSRSKAIEDPRQQANALSELASSLSYLNPKDGPNDQFLAAYDQIEKSVSAIENQDKRTDVMGKLYSSLAAHGQLDSAYKEALKLSAESPTQASYKSRTIREISAHMARQGQFDSAIAALENLQGSFTYYQAVARTGIVSEAIKQNKQELIQPLLDESVQIGRSQENGYFTAGVLRDVAYNHIQLGNMQRAEAFIEEARAAARLAQKQNEQARSMSRIATKLADAQKLDQVEEMINESLNLAMDVESGVMRNYALYEIAGSAAFAGLFATAQAIIKGIPDSPFGSATSLKSASERDFAWGLARHGHISEAIETARSITSPRERVQALSRIVRLLNNPEMNALPRYL